MPKSKVGSRAALFLLLLCWLLSQMIPFVFSATQRNLRRKLLRLRHMFQYKREKDLKRLQEAYLAAKAKVRSK